MKKRFFLHKYEPHKGRYTYYYYSLGDDVYFYNIETKLSSKTNLNEGRLLANPSLKEVEVQELALMI